MLEVALGIEQPALRLAGADCPPAVVAPFAGQREVDAEVERRVSLRFAQNFGRPGARHHHRTTFNNAKLGQFEKGLVAAVTHAHVIGMKEDKTTFGGYPQLSKKRILHKKDSPVLNYNVL